MRAYAEVIGDPVAQSKSPLIHKFWLDQLGIDADYRLQRVTPEDLAGYIAQRRWDDAWLGCNVTMPLKQAVMAQLDNALGERFLGEELAGRIAAVNTIIPRKDRSLAGINTDAFGFFEPLAHRAFALGRGRRALVIGNGGAARAIVVRLADARVPTMAPMHNPIGQIALAVRGRAKGEALLHELTPHQGHGVVDLARLAQPAGDGAPRYDLVVNASPLGMTGKPALHFDLSHVAPAGIVYDIVTSPLETPLLVAARAAGLLTIDGLAMLIGQAAAAFRLFFGHDAPRADSDAQLRRLLTA